MDKENLFFLNSYQSQNKDYTLLIDTPQKNTQKCPFCGIVLESSHSNKCMMYELPLIPIWYFLLPLMLSFVLFYIYITSKIKKYKNKK